MSFHLTRLFLKDFRNYAGAEFFLDEQITVLVGPNAAGKTNAIEAIQLVTSAESFRKPPWAELVRWGADSSRVLLEASGEERELELELQVESDGSRLFKVNGAKKRRLIDVRGIIPSVVFTPDDLRMVKGSAERRRDTIDSVGQQISPAYGALRREYGRILRQRNTLLKESGFPGIDEWSERLVETGSRLAAHRMRLLARLAGEAKGIHAAMSSGQTLTIIYAGSWSETAEEPGVEQDVDLIGEAMTRRMSEVEGEERARGMTLVGPHRDDVLFSLDGHSARAFASQGQQRTIALAVKLAEVEVVRDLAASPPVLLLDDVMSELDEARRAELTKFVGGWAQTVVTTTNIHYFGEEVLGGAAVIEVGE